MACHRFQEWVWIFWMETWIHYYILCTKIRGIRWIQRRSDSRRQDFSWYRTRICTFISRAIASSYYKLLRLGCLPENWKLANIVSVIKKDNKDKWKTTDRSRYFLIVSKVIERCIFNAIRDHVSNLISACHHGFLAERSSVTQLVEVLDQVGAKEEPMGSCEKLDRRG